jgi:hypothetical protein
MWRSVLAICLVGVGVVGFISYQIGHDRGADDKMMEHARWTLTAELAISKTIYEDQVGVWEEQLKANDNPTARRNFATKISLARLARAAQYQLILEMPHAVFLPQAEADYMEYEVRMNAPELTALLFR